MRIQHRQHSQPRVYLGGGGGGGGNYMITVSVHRIYLVDFDLPQFLLVVISKLIFTLSSQAQMLT